MQEHIKGQSEPKQPQAATLANPFIIPMHRKNKGQKKSVSKTPCASVKSVSFFDLRSVAEAHRTNYDKAYLYSYSNNIYIVER